MKSKWLLCVLLSLMVGILLVGMFSHLFFVMKEEVTMGKRLPIQSSAFTSLSLMTHLTPGETTITIGKGWFERKRAGIFVIGGFQRLILDRVTITVPQLTTDEQVSESLGKLLPRELSLDSIVLAEVRRLELRETKANGGNAFLRAALVEIPAGKNKPILLQNAWFRESAQAKWEQLQQAWIEREEELTRATLKIVRKNGAQRTIPLAITL